MRSEQNQTTLSRRSFLGKGVAGASLLCLPSKLFAAYEEAADAAENEVVLRFSALSDVHLKKNADCEEAKRFRRSIKFLYDYSSKQKYTKFDGMLVAGDFSDHGYDEELLLFKTIMDEEIKDETTTILCMGNHEFIAGSKKRWEEIFERDSNKVYDVNGFKFVALSPERGTCRDGDFLYALDWFEKQISDANADDSGKPIFTFQHYHVTPTVYGSRGEDNWGTKDLFETLQKYPRVIDFSGHSHYPINDPRSAWQGRFTAFGTGTLSYFEMGGEGGKYNKFPEGFHKAAQLYIVEVRKDNSVVLKPYDLITNTFFDVVYFVAKPGNIEKYVYTDERYKTSAKPVWTDEAKVVCSDVNSDGARFTFPQATCKDVVHSYRIDFKKLVDNDWKDFGSQYFWSEYYFKDQPKEMRVAIETLDPESSYRAEIVALNPFFKESEQKLTAEFRTTKDLIDTVDKNAPKPDANMLDVRFVNGKVVNEPVNALEKQKTVETFGKPKIVADAALAGAFVGVFNGVDERLKVKFSSRDFGRMRNITIAAKFKFDAFVDGGNQVVFANTENAGVSLELNPQTRSLEFWASVNGQYKIVSAEVKPGEYIDAFGTYDGENVVLYINGKEAARVKAIGKLTHPQTEAVQAFCIASDIANQGSGSSYFNGSIERARLFTWGLTAEQVKNLCK